MLSDLRRGAHGAILVQVSTPNIMNCDEYLPFWVRWEGQTIEIGTGSVDSHVFMKFTDPSMHTIVAASVTSWYNLAEYQFPETQGEYLVTKFFQIVIQYLT